MKRQHAGVRHHRIWTRTVSSKGQCVVPAALRRHLAMAPGDTVIISIVPDGFSAEPLRSPATLRAKRRTSGRKKKCEEVAKH